MTTDFFVRVYFTASCITSIKKPSAPQTQWRGPAQLLKLEDLELSRQLLATFTRVGTPDILTHLTINLEKFQI